MLNDLRFFRYFRAVICYFCFLSGAAIMLMAMAVVHDPAVLPKEIAAIGSPVQWSTWLLTLATMYFALACFFKKAK